MPHFSGIDIFTLKLIFKHKNALGENADSELCARKNPCAEFLTTLAQIFDFKYLLFHFRFLSKIVENFIFLF